MSSIVSVDISWINKRSHGKSLLSFRIVQPLQDEVASLLDTNNFSYVKKTRSFRVTVDKTSLEANAAMFKEIAALVKRSWTKGI